MHPPGTPDSATAALRKSGEVVSLQKGASGTEPLTPGVLPLRLSVAHGGLGLELSAPIDLGALVVEEFDVGLVGLSYPVDLSHGVKQFRNRRSKLRRAVVRLDLSRISEEWAQSLTGVFGELVKVRLSPAFEEGFEELPGEGSESGEANDGQRASALAVTIYTETSSLAFDLVLASGVAPRFIVDSPRLVGRQGAALLLALQSLDAGLELAELGPSDMTRVGRTLEVKSLARAVALAVLPALGCRLPEVQDQVIRRVSAFRGNLVLELGRGEEPFAAGRRALRTSGLADFLRKGDDLLGSGDLSGARAAYMACLEQSPGHNEILQELAELDFSIGDRAESALAFLQEQAASLDSSGASQSRARHFLTMARALAGTGRPQAAAETLGRAAREETDPTVASLIECELSQLAETPSERSEHLDRAVGHAPFYAHPRLLRFEHALKLGDLRTASADAETLEAAQEDSAARATMCVKVGRSFGRAGYTDRARKWLKLALRLVPDGADAMVELAACLKDAGESLRAAELYQVAIRRLTTQLEADEVPGSVPREEPSLLAEARFELASLLARELEEETQALAHLAAVDSRAQLGTKARLLEAEIHDRLGRFEERDRVLTRLLEAADLGWLSLENQESRLRKLLRSVRKNGDESLLSFARRLLSLDV